MVSDVQPTSGNTLISSPISLSKINWKQVAAFLLLTFGLTWTLDLVLYLKGGLNSPVITLALQFQMLLPAFSAMFLGMFFFKDSKIYIKNNKTTSRWFVWYFLFFTILYAAALIVGIFRPYDLQIISSIMLLPSVVGLILVIVLRVIGGKESFASVGMGGGKAKYWLLFGIGIVVYAGLLTFLNWLFKMGQPVDLGILKSQAASSGLPFPVLMVLATVQTIILGPFLGLLVTFGEEYGWRGYLQPALTRIGRVWGVLLVGIIWGLWHAPIIWMGYNYPGHPYLGPIIMTVFCIGLAFLLGYAVLKAKGVWIAAFLHALVNQSFAFFMTVVYMPNDPAFSFGIGLLSLIVMVPLILLILWDPVWKESD